MVEQGLVLLINAGIASACPGLTGGFPVQLPENFITATNPYSWTYRSILSEPLYTLQGQNPLTKWEVQIDCHGTTMLDAATVAKAVDSVLRGVWQGTMTDPDSTVVQGIYRQPGFIDGFSDISRTYVRSLEYKVIYVQQ